MPRVVLRPEVVARLAALKDTLNQRHREFEAACDERQRNGEARARIQMIAKEHARVARRRARIEEEQESTSKGSAHSTSHWRHP